MPNTPYSDPGFLELHWHSCFLITICIAVGAGAVLAYFNRHSGLSRRNLGVIILVAGWSSGYAILDYASSMSSLRNATSKTYVSIADTDPDVTEKREHLETQFENRRAIAVWAVFLKSLAVLGVLGGAAWASLRLVPTEFEKTLKDIMDEWTHVNVPALLYRKSKTGPQLIHLNDFARSYLLFEKTKGVEPVGPIALYSKLAVIMENYAHFTQHEAERREQAKAEFRASTTNVAQIISLDHPDPRFHGSLYCSTIPIESKGTSYFLTLIRPDSSFTNPATRELPPAQAADEEEEVL